MIIKLVARTISERIRERDQLFIQVYSSIYKYQKLFFFALRTHFSNFAKKEEINLKILEMIKRKRKKDLTTKWYPIASYAQKENLLRKMERG